MPRGGRFVEKREVLPDPKFKSVLATKFIHKIMVRGEKALARKLFYSAMDKIADRSKKDPMEVLDEAMKNVGPVLELKSRRIGGANYQVPIEVKKERRVTISVKWIRDGARAKKGKNFDECLCDEILDAYNKTGYAFNKKEETHRMAEANRAFAHFAKF